MHNNYLLYNWYWKIVTYECIFGLDSFTGYFHWCATLDCALRKLKFAVVWRVSVVLSGRKMLKYWSNCSIPFLCFVYTCILVLNLTIVQCGCCVWMQWTEAVFCGHCLLITYGKLRFWTSKALACSIKCFH